MNEWIIAGIAITIIITIAVLATMLLLERQERKNARNQRHELWRVELWRIADGSRLVLEFQNHLILGRDYIYNTIGDVHGHPDNSISRQHCMFYEQEDGLWIWNLSMVNPASINGIRLNSPKRLAPGDRLELGYSSFLITRVEFV